MGEGVCGVCSGILFGCLWGLEVACGDWEIVWSGRLIGEFG